MFPSPAALVINHYSQNHQTIMKFLQRLTDEQLHWQLPAGSHSIAWHAWHLGRWADHTQAALPGMAPELSRFGDNTQVWYTEGLAACWGFVGDQLGYDETGMYMLDEIAQELSFPSKDQLLDYVSRAFERADERINTISDQEFQTAEQPQLMNEGIFGEGTIGAAILAHVIHDYRHLGMMEVLLGLQGQPGTATR
jgi:uncharacterized damage-inducible protein DinB